MPRRAGTGEGSVWADRGRGEYVVEWTNREGKRLRQRGFPLTKPGLRAAKAHLAAWKTDASRNLRVGDRQTVAHLAETWLAERVRPHREPKTVQYYEYLIRDYLVPAFGPTRVSALTGDAVQALVNQMTAAGKSASLVRGARACLRTMLNYAISRRLVAVNVAAVGITLPPARHEPVEPLSAEDARELLDVTRGHRLHALYALALATGARVGELIALRWEDIDWQAGTVHYRRQAQRLAGQTIIKAPKRHGSRRAHLPAETLAELRAHRERLTESGLGGSPWVFPNTRGELLDATVVTHTLARRLRQAGYEPIKTHCLRHAAATLMLRGGASAPEVARVLGHRDASMVTRVYGHALDDSAERIARSLDGMFARPAVADSPTGTNDVSANGTTGEAR